MTADRVTQDADLYEIAIEALPLLETLVEGATFGGYAEPKKIAERIVGDLSRALDGYRAQRDKTREIIGHADMLADAFGTWNDHRIKTGIMGGTVGVDLADEAAEALDAYRDARA